MNNIVALQAGVVQQDGKLYIRGGRSGEVAYYVDGANATNPYSSAENISVIQEAIEEIQVQSGGFTAEFGGANSGVVRTNVRTGGGEMKVSLDYQTDDFAKPGEQFLGTTAFGFRNVVATLGGPVPSLANVKFFLVGQHNYVRDRNPMFLEPFRFEGLTTDGNAGRPAGQLLPNGGVVEFKKNYLYNNWTESNTIQGTLSYSMNPFNFRFTGSYAKGQSPNGSDWPSALSSYFNQGRDNLNEATTTFGNLRITHFLDASTFYEVGLSYSNRYHRNYDQNFGDDWKLYTDSLANAQKGYTGFVRRYQGPLNYSTILGFNFSDPNAPNNSYSKDQQTSYGATVDFVSQISSQWEIKAGGRIEAWTMRLYSIGNIETGMSYLYGITGTTPRAFASDEERRVLFRKQASINNYGYDVDGNEVSGGFDEARRPVFGSAYVQNKIEYKDLILNVGARYEYYSTNDLVPTDLVNPAFDRTLDAIDESKLVKKDPVSFFLPRVSFSFPATDRTVFYAQYGRYVQLPSLTRIYMGNGVLSSRISPVTRAAIGSGAVSYLIVPEKTTQYEIGIRQIVSDNLAFTMSGFYKHVTDLLEYNKFPTLETPIYVALKNEDFSTIKGLELTLELRRVRRLAANINYTLSNALGTGSDPTDFYAAVSDVTIGTRFPVQTNPLKFDQTHRGQVILDYRFGRGDGGPVFEGFGANFVLSFNSGHPYTKIKEISELGQSNPWTVGVRTPSRRQPTEAINSSTTPWVFNVDLNLNKAFFFDNLTVEVYASILNLFNTKSIINVYETTGAAQDDGWLISPLSDSFRAVPNYTAFYKAINLNNRYAYINQFGNDLYGPPRQMRLGVKLEM